MTDKPLRALRRFCLECQGGHPPSVAACRDVDCLLYALRRQPGTPAGEDAAPGDADQDRAETGSGGAAAAPGCDAAAPAGSEGGPGRPVRVIRRFCLLCGGSRAEVRACDARDSCPLWSYRFGVLPATFKRVLARQRRVRSELTLPGLPK